MLADVLTDFRYALRRLAAAPGFTLAVVLTLGVGIGANVLVADLLDGVYFRGLPYRDDSRLVYIEDSNTKQGPDADGGMISIPDYLDRRRDVPALEDSALYLTTDLNLVGVGQPERLRAIRATPSLFTTLGVGAGARPNVHRRGSDARPRQGRRAQRRAPGATASTRIRPSSGAISTSAARRIASSA